MKRSFPFVAVLFALGIVGVVSQRPVLTYEGSSDYQAFCASCHGASGKGDGIVARSLAKKPADLTQLAKKNAGAFPTERVVKTIDSGAGSHGGSADMPEWLSVFEKSSTSPGKAEATMRINALVRYLESIQEKP